MTAPRHRHRPLISFGLLCIALLAMPSQTPAAGATAIGAPTLAELAGRIDAHIAQPRFAAADWGIAVVSLDSGRTLYAHHADQLLQPASTAKLFTAATSLATLGPDYRFPTRVMANGVLRNGRLEGQLILYGMGDPTLGTTMSAAWADQLAGQLAARGIRFVHGDLVADDSYFASPSFGSGWEAGDLQSWFAVPSSALSVQENVAELTVSPARAVGDSAQVAFTPADAAWPVEGRLVTGAARSRDDINLYRAPGENSLHIFGSIAARRTPQHFRLALPDPALLAGKRLRQALLDHGIRVTGKLVVMHWPQDDSTLLAHATTLGEVLSPPLLDILQQGLKRSQNLYLQNLLLSVGAQQRATDPDPPAGFANAESYGIRAMHRLLEKIGVTTSDSQITEGTGLSRRDLVTPNAMVRLLAYLAVQPYANALQDALPDAGVDGTLTARMRGTAAAGNVRAKTGNMMYVHCLAGYVTTAAGEHVAFAIMLNNYLPSAQSPRASSDVDAIAVMLAGFIGRS
ncbi:D-alanyl-D-alanine carboxypeptidase/D-alanyl-D-alanine-endopeptidase [Rhodanobacter sp. L36]|uniref:D-alanyl-D-alanine carboxypeptidase/D-alanyl-D-alanine endopeptidase n=1 Tax=Rhodanobacter sp. L36 TaxID=1747221 RepID=UPI00131A9AE6|nr:D-alanyl-D-alanine carboxypeptidase/D-alanyl-D-alanine-endopeptidase [Rhodanobacter sp. L36]